MCYSYIFIFFLLSIVFPTQVNLMIDEVINRKNKYSHEEIIEFSKVKTGEVNLLVLKGLIENDGESAHNYFKHYLDTEPEGEYSELAKVKLGEYYYAKGSYITASYWYKDVIMNYPESIYIKSVINYFLNSLSVSNQLDSAKYYTKFLENKYPMLNFNEKFHSNNNSFRNNNSSDKNINTKRDFSVEIGIYEYYSKAFNYKGLLSAEGFFSRIDEIVVNNNKMFSLRVGYFTTYEKAEMHKKRIYSRLGLSNLSIIKLEQ